jgi:membrane protein implicated in regulation of membrane protease activity
MNIKHMLWTYGFSLVVGIVLMWALMILTGPYAAHFFAGCLFVKTWLLEARLEKLTDAMAHLRGRVGELEYEYKSNDHD